MNELPSHDQPVDGRHYCPCGTTFIEASGRMPTRSAVCAACMKPTARVPTSPEVRRHAAEVASREE